VADNLVSVLVWLAAGVAIVIAAVAVMRVVRSAWGKKPPPPKS